MARWSDKDLQSLKGKGLGVLDNHLGNKTPKTGEIAIIKKPIKQVKRSYEKDYIASILDKFHLTKLIDGFVSEHRFDDQRQFRFDWAVPSLNLGIEFEGIMSEKSRHTTLKGYTNDAEKYNLAAINGWIVLRYTVINYLNFERDLLKVITIFEKQNRTMCQHDTVSNNHNKSDLL